MTERTENAIQEILNQWDLGYIRSVSVVNTTAVTRAMIELREAAMEERSATLRTKETA